MIENLSCHKRICRRYQWSPLFLYILHGEMHPQLLSFALAPNIIQKTLLEIRRRLVSTPTIFNALPTTLGCVSSMAWSWCLIILFLGNLVVCHHWSNRIVFGATQSQHWWVTIPLRFRIASSTNNTNTMLSFVNVCPSTSDAFQRHSTSPFLRKSNQALDALQRPCKFLTRSSTLLRQSEEFGRSGILKSWGEDGIVDATAAPVAAKQGPVFTMRKTTKVKTLRASVRASCWAINWSSMICCCWQRCRPFSLAKWLAMSRPSRTRCKLEILTDLTRSC